MRGDRERERTPTRAPTPIALLLLALTACAPPLDRGTHTPRRFTNDHVRTTGHALAARVGELLVLEGDGLVSGIDDAYGIRFDDEVDDLAKITARLAEEGADGEGIIVLFTTFDDLGAGGPAYYVPFFDDVAGTGDDDVDQRAAFGVERLEGIVNMKQLGDEDEALFFHEIAHRHLAHLEATVGGSTAAVTMLGRQRAHWHALLHTEGSVLGGHGFVESRPGRFVVQSRNERYAPLDLYGLGLADADEVPPFFFVADATTEDGAAIPAEAQLPVGTAILGRRIDVTIEDVVARVGPRDPGVADRTLRYVVLTAPGEAAESVDLAPYEAFRVAMAAAYVAYTDGRGSLCSRFDGCAPPTKLPADETGCSCSSTRRSGPWGKSAWGWVFVALLWSARGRTHRRADARPRSTNSPIETG
ncbi:MAG: hypothetical protein RIT81_33910 [Deltaproteobacteria bacterium]